MHHIFQYYGACTEPYNHQHMQLHAIIYHVHAFPMEVRLQTLQLKFRLTGIPFPKCFLSFESQHLLHCLYQPWIGYLSSLLMKQLSLASRNCDHVCYKARQHALSLSTGIASAYRRSSFSVISSTLNVSSAVCMKKNNTTVTMHIKQLQMIEN